MKALLLVAGLFILLPVHAQQHPLDIIKPAVGLVSTEETAIRIALAVLEPIYGKEQIAKEQPFTATLKNDIWLVKGSLPKGARGGVAEVEISEEDGKIIGVRHGQ